MVGDRNPLPRRLALQQAARGSATFGLSARLLPSLALHANEPVTAHSPKVKSCLFWFLAGGLSQIDTFDMKPHAPTNIRGEFATVPSNVPGMWLCDQLPHVAGQMDKLRVVRSMHHRMLCHNPGIYAALSGREVGESLAVSNKTFATRDDYPQFGSIISRLTPAPDGAPSAVSFPFQLRNGPATSPGQHAGWLGQAFDPLTVLADPNADDFQVRELSLPDDVTAHRFQQRDDLLRRLDGARTPLERTLSVQAAETYYRRGLSLLGAQRVQQAFELSREPTVLRERYGRNTVGQSALLGRRLIEAGVPFVTIYSPVANIDEPSWDTHLNNFPRLRDQLLPPFDQALATLLDDLQQRGMLDETLLVISTEFGRTPEVGARRSNNANNSTGRDHWPGCYSILLAGAGVAGGTYYGASDRFGWAPKEQPVHVGDFAASLLDAFGIDPQQTVRDALGRPHQLTEGSVVPGLFG
ncbi:MAG TPA: DUF1501 domain-containing protein [Planctomycetaceae bacterium]|nr:DUF1501 domain-containing protein [Planctomycetaceae bacterium]